MLVAVLSTYLPLGHLAPMLEMADPTLEAVVWPDPRCIEAEVVACLHPPANIYERMPNLKLIHCVSAGVDSILVDQRIERIPVCRVVAPTLAEGVFQYALWGVIHFHRKFDEALLNQLKHAWVRQPRRLAANVRVGVMGLGAIGGVVAVRLALLDYDVRGWSRMPRTIEGVKTFNGGKELQNFLTDLDVLICTLPLTDDTKGILNRETFSWMKKGAALIHCGRGEQLVRDDLIAALLAGHLGGALLDVVPNEPLPASDPLWSTPRVIITPHMASTASDEEIIQQLTENITRLREHKPLLHVVDVSRGY